jgi:hypothetical protein
MTDSINYNDPRRLFQLWKELTGEDLIPNQRTIEKKEARGK